MLIETVNKATGHREWQVKGEEYDLTQEIARSSFADMLHDDERNRMFEQGLISVIRQLRDQNEPVHVLDIGTGSGLLAMMAVRAGADSVTAVEVFRPMAALASRVFSRNGCNGDIRLIDSRSTELNGLSNPINLIVAEVFDTELIGEGALRTFKEAGERLVGSKKGYRTVPSSARIWVQPVQSDLLARFCHLPDRRLKSSHGNCPGSSAVFDIQLSQISKEQLTPLCEALLAFEFNFEDDTSIEYDESTQLTFKVPMEGVNRVDAVMMWWDLDMDGDRSHRQESSSDQALTSGENRLSTAPQWHHSSTSAWRDHWMQAVYLLPSISVESGQSLCLQAVHDEFSFWFDINDGRMSIERPVCSCQLHTLCSRNAFYRMNALDEDDDFDRLLQRECAGRNVLVLGEGSLLGVLVARHTTEMVTVVDSNERFRRVLNEYKRDNGFEHRLRIVESIETIRQEEGDIDLVIGEPFFFSSMLPWHNLRFWNELDALKKRRNVIRVLPQEATLWALPVCFEHLWKIVAPVKTVLGFDLSDFDQLCQGARNMTDAQVEPQPLWEYPSIATGGMMKLAVFPIDQPIISVTSTNKIEFSSETNGIAFWMEWRFDEYSMSSGLTIDCPIGHRPSWNRGHRQGVFLFGTEKAMSTALDLTITFQPSTGETSFVFS